MVQFDKRPELLRIATDDGEQQRHVVAGDAEDGFWSCPTAIQVLSNPASIGGNTRWLVSGGGILPR
jgi:hypothetical protein